MPHKSKLPTLLPLDRELLVKPLKVLLEKCIELNLECRDPYLLTTSFLYSLGYTQYRIRKLWKVLSSAKVYEIIIYKYINSIFSIKMVYEHGPVTHIIVDGIHIPVDRLDVARHHSLQIVKTPHSHKAVAYLEGKISEHINVKINIIRILVLLYKSQGKEVVEKLLNEIEKLMLGRYSKLDREILNIILKSNCEILQLLVPKVPRNLDDLYRLSPALRKLRAEHVLSTS